MTSKELRENALSALARIKDAPPTAERDAAIAKLEKILSEIHDEQPDKRGLCVVCERLIDAETAERRNNQEV